MRHTYQYSLWFCRCLLTVCGRCRSSVTKWSWISRGNPIDMMDRNNPLVSNSWYPMWRIWTSWASEDAHWCWVSFHQMIEGFQKHVDTQILLVRCAKISIGISCSSTRYLDNGRIIWSEDMYQVCQVSLISSTVLVLHPGRCKSCLGQSFVCSDKSVPEWTRSSNFDQILINIQ